MYETVVWFISFFLVISESNAGKDSSPFNGVLF